MVVVKLYNQLGNQMLIYSAVKSICIDYGLNFKIWPTKIKKKSEINDCGKKYGREIYTIFSDIKNELISEEEISNLKFDYTVKYLELLNVVGEKEISSKNILVENWEMNARIIGKHIPEVCSWFQFPQDIVLNNRNVIKTYEESALLVSVHFRCGRDYLKGAYQLKSSYWLEAANYLIEKNRRQNIKFMVFADDLNCTAVKRFRRKFKNDCIISNGDLTEDINLMSMCGAHIVCNSTFSVMGALLDPNESHLTIRPAKAPCGTGYMGNELFPEQNNWIVVGDGGRSIGAFFFKVIRIILKR